jgi:methyl-accepting chemotaxis protein
MINRYSIQKKLLVPYLGSILLLFILFSFIALVTLRKHVERSVMTEARQLLEWNASEIRGFFVERGRIPLTVYKDPFILQWFTRYHQFRASVRQDPDDQRIISLFRNLIDSDSTVNSVYFATENTQEYFDEDGRYEQDGYFVKDRPWWHKAVKMGRLYCQPSDYDYEDSTLAATLQMPIYLPDGRLLGVGGIDIEINTIGNLVSRLKYNGQGQAFLLDETGNIFVLPGYDPDLWYMRPLESMDIKFNTEGFTHLANQMKHNSAGNAHVLWQGIPHLVFFQGVQSERPYFRSQLGIMIPEQLIYSQVRQMTWSTMWVIFLIGLLIVIFGTLRTLRVLRPLDALSLRLYTIASGKPDLTQELPVQSRDSIGQTAQNFNTFIKQIRELISALIVHTQDVGGKVHQLHGSYRMISDDSRQVSDKVEQVAGTSKEMVIHVEEVMNGVREVAKLSRQLLQIIDQGKNLVHERMKRMGEITNSTISLHDDMQKLYADSNALIERVKNIEDINNRISMLSVNASIEAVKAGEKGYGFAVVAKEIESLSQNTALTNQQTLHVVRTFSESMEQFQKDLQEMKNTMESERRSFTAISEMFFYLADHASHADESSVKMQVENQQQVESLRMINDHIQNISGNIKNVTESIILSDEQISNIYEHMLALQKSAGLFKV